MFDFNDSLNDVAPVSPMLLPVNAKYMKSGSLLKTLLCVFYLVFTAHIELRECCV